MELKRWQSAVNKSGLLGNLRDGCINTIFWQDSLIYEVWITTMKSHEELPWRASSKTSAPVAGAAKIWSSIETHQQTEAFLQKTWLSSLKSPELEPCYFTETQSTSEFSLQALWSGPEGSGGHSRSGGMEAETWHFGRLCGSWTSWSGSHPIAWYY